MSRGGDCARPAACEARGAGLCRRCAMARARAAARAPEVEARRLAAMRDPATRAATAERMREQWRDPEMRARWLDARPVRERRPRVRRARPARPFAAVPAAKVRFARLFVAAGWGLREVAGLFDVRPRDLAAALAGEGVA